MATSLNRDLSPQEISVSQLRAKHFLIDMDGVIYRGDRIIPGADRFIASLKTLRRKFLFLTNASSKTPKELQAKLFRLGIEVPAESFYTSALATAAFLESQNPSGTAYAVGEKGLIEALREVGYKITEKSPDYVVLGQTEDFSKLKKAVQLIAQGVPFIATNPDITGPAEEGIEPAVGAVAAMIEKATGKSAYFIGKPNPLMMRKALQRLVVHSSETAIIGDRMDTDIMAGVETGLQTILVLSGVSSLEDIVRYPFRPNFVVSSVSQIKL
jgi:NagD protein